MFHDFKCMILKCYDFQSVIVSSIFGFERVILWKYYDFEMNICLKCFWFRSINYFDWINSFEIKMVLVSKYKLFWKKYSLKWNDLIFLKYKLFWNDHGVIITFGC